MALPARDRLARLCSPAGLVRVALLIAILYGALHVLGLRAQTSFLCGQLPHDRGTLLLAAAYVAAYFAFYLAAPILLLAAAVLWGLLRVAQPAATPRSQAATASDEPKPSAP